MVVTLGQQYNVGEKPTVILYTYINRHAGPPEKHQKQNRNNVVHGTFNMPTSYQWWVWEREANMNWSMVTCQGSTRSELP